MTMMPPRTKIDGLNGGLAFRGARQGVNSEAAGLVNPAQGQLITAAAQTQQVLDANASPEATRMLVEYKDFLQRGLLAKDPGALEALRELAAKPGILGNTGYVLG